jgi:hypothetical protein
LYDLIVVAGAEGYFQFGVVTIVCLANIPVAIDPEGEFEVLVAAQRVDQPGQYSLGDIDARFPIVPDPHHRTGSIQQEKDPCTFRDFLLDFFLAFGGMREAESGKQEKNGQMA